MVLELLRFRDAHLVEDKLLCGWGGYLIETL